ncbi:MAG: hypothetical protein ACRELA_21945, partial [Candidatus Rokuibacteriota bacterium]
RGEIGVFHSLRESFKEEPEVEVVWDRRVGERRQAQQGVSPDQRGADRRVAPPSSWQILGVMVVAREHVTGQGGGRAGSP